MTENRRGRNWDIAVIYGSDCYDMTMRLLEEIDAVSLIPSGGSVLIKPNLLLPSPAGEGATTHTRLAAAVIDYLRGHGIEKLAVAEGSWIGAKTEESAQICGFATLCELKGLPFYDLKKDAYLTKTVAGIPIEISRRVAESDFIVNLPVLKGHCQTLVTCALKNAKGCISDRSKRAFHSMGLHKPIAALNTLLPPQLAVVDGICGDLDFEEGGNPVFAGRVFAGTDPVLVDSYGCTLLGYGPEQVEYIGMAAQLGVGSDRVEDLRLLELSDGETPPAPAPTRRVRALQKHLVAEDACSACYSAAIHALARLEEQGKLGRLGEKLYIGRGYRDKKLDHAGIGSCCRGFSCALGGCPPTASQILTFLTGEIERK